MFRLFKVVFRTERKNKESVSRSGLRNGLIGLGSVMLTIPTLSYAEASPKNIIIMIGDGMGVAHTSAYRYYKNERAKDGSIATTELDDIFVGLSRTYPLDKTVVTDSAAGATALSAGIKTYNGAIGVDVDKKPVETALELAKKQGWATGAVTTVQVNHATPASFIAHNESRNNYDALADAYIDEKINGKLKFDVLLGGGRQHFERADRNIINEFRELDATVITDLNDLAQASRTPLIGLFADKGMPFIVDDNAQAGRLPAMTTTALKLLSDKSGPFFLMVEGGEIDWCSHRDDIACAMKEMADFEGAVAVAKDYVDAHPDTLLVITADHETGGLSVGGWDQKAWSPESVKQIHISGDGLAGKVMALDLTNDDAATTLEKVWNDYIEFALSESETAKIIQARKSGSLDILAKTIRTILNKNTITGWTSLQHSASDVQIFAYGAGAEKFKGSMENIQIGKTLLNMVKQ